MRTDEHAAGTAGQKLYVFKNKLGSDLKVPALTGSGERRIAPGEEFVGDHSLMRFVRFGMASLVREITAQDREQAIMDRFLNKVFHGDALKLLQVLPTASADAVITDPMYGTAKKCLYDWGPDPAGGDPEKHWFYHEPIYQECRRVLKPGGVLAWAQGFKFRQHLDAWFGPHRIWIPVCIAHGFNFTPNVWIVQTREQQPIDHPNNMIVRVDRNAFVPLKELHPCPKPLEEMLFMVSHLTQPGQIILDPFCGLGSTLLAAEQLGRRWIGSDLSRRYCQITMKRLAELRAGRHDEQMEGAAAPNPKDGSSTPKWLFDVLNKQVMALTGEAIQLDAAASEWNAKYADYWDEEMDALKQDWSEWRTIFCNPPYKAALIEKFVPKALEAAEKGSTVVLLIPSWPGYPWFQELKRRGQMQDIIGPIAFERPDGSKFVLNNGANKTSLVVATLGPKITPGTNGEAIRKRRN